MIIFQEDEVINPIYTGLSEDDRFIGKLLTAQNVMVNIQTELTRLIKDYIQIKKKDQKRREKFRGEGGVRNIGVGKTPLPPTPKQSNNKVLPDLAKNRQSGQSAKRKKQTMPQGKQPQAKKAKSVHTPATPVSNHHIQNAPHPMTSTPLAQGIQFIYVKGLLSHVTHQSHLNHPNHLIHLTYLNQ